MKFVVIKKKLLYKIFVFLFIVVSILSIYFTTQAVFVPKYQYTIVLDAGHGGIDGGCTGSDENVKESDLNLAIVKKMIPYFENFGFGIVLTRTDVGGLYDNDASNKKLSDMENRKEIIQKSNANLIISIHMNSFPDTRQKGIQAFYQQNNVDSKELADTIQSHLIAHIDNARSFANQGDYYILQCSYTPTVLIECGYLSNPEEESLLITDDYQEKLAYNIFCGVLKYLKVVG